MIIVQLSGDLGNQMFQYAFGRRLALIHKTDLKLDITGFEQLPTNYRLDHFNIQAAIAETKDVSQLINLHHLRSGDSQIDPSLFDKQTTITANPYLVTVHDNTYLTGRCWTLSYFNKIAPYLHRELRIKTLPSNSNKHYLKQIAKENAIAVYLYKTPADETNRDDISVDYYYRAIEIIANQVKHPIFYLFSNDPVWCRQNFMINYPYHLIDHNRDVTEFEDFRLMRNCKHQIIANTAISWWAAWLNPYKKKIVIAPKKWCNNDESAEDFIPPDWLQLEN